MKISKLRESLTKNDCDVLASLLREHGKDLLLEDIGNVVFGQSCQLLANTLFLQGLTKSDLLMLTFTLQSYPVNMVIERLGMDGRKVGELTPEHLELLQFLKEQVNFTYQNGVLHLFSDYNTCTALVGFKPDSVESEVEWASKNIMGYLIDGETLIHKRVMGAFADAVLAEIGLEDLSDVHTIKVADNFVMTVKARKGLGVHRWYKAITSDLESTVFYMKEPTGEMKLATGSLVNEVPEYVIKTGWEATYEALRGKRIQG